MFKFIFEILKRLCCNEYPLWTYGLECSVCMMSFETPELHQDHARKKRTVKKHLTKIPKL